MFCNDSMTVHHIGYAVEDIIKAKEAFSLLGYKTGEGVIRDTARNLTILMLTKENTSVELISFLDREKESPIDFLFKAKGGKFRGGTPYHICYTVDDIGQAVEFLKSNNFIVIKAMEKAVAFDDKDVIFLFHKDMGIIELLQK